MRPSSLHDAYPRPPPVVEQHHHSHDHNDPQHTILDDFLLSQKHALRQHDEGFHRALDDHLRDEQHRSNRSLALAPPAAMPSGAHFDSRLMHSTALPQYNNNNNTGRGSTSRSIPQPYHDRGHHQYNGYHHENHGHEYEHHHHQLPPPRSVPTVVRAAPPPPPPPPESSINLAMVLAAVFLIITLGLLGVGIGTTEWFVVSSASVTTGVLRQTFSIIGAVETTIVVSGVQSSTTLNHWSKTCTGSCVGVTVQTCDALSSDSTDSGKWYYNAVCALGGATLTFVILAISIALVSLIVTIAVLMERAPWWFGIPFAFASAFFSLLALFIYAPWMANRGSTDYLPTSQTHVVGYSLGVVIGAMFTALIAGILEMIGAQDYKMLKTSKLGEDYYKTYGHPDAISATEMGYYPPQQKMMSPIQPQVGYSSDRGGVTLIPGAATTTLSPYDINLHNREVINPLRPSHLREPILGNNVPRVVTTFPMPNTGYDDEVDRLARSYDYLHAEAQALQEDACQAADAAEKAKREAEEMRAQLQASETQMAHMRDELDRSRVDRAKRDQLLDQLEGNLQAQKSRALKASQVLDTLAVASNEAVAISNTASVLANERNSPAARSAQSSPRLITSPPAAIFPLPPPSLAPNLPTSALVSNLPMRPVRSIRTPQQWRQESADLFSHHSNRGQA